MAEYRTGKKKKKTEKLFSSFGTVAKREYLLFIFMKNYEISHL